MAGVKTARRDMLHLRTGAPLDANAASRKMRGVPRFRRKNLPYTSDLSLLR
ncbi:hypothetical protein ERY430_40054 [Erythrobacter sp. EC-HK427]|nr:hypothetical protein ERY430_40054 [Erythrobacter sp. EC-HK427]